MIVAFDMDDTLYRELDYVESGFREVAKYVAATYAVTAKVALATLLESHDEFGRGRQFDDLLNSLDSFTVQRRNRLVQIYRQHNPEIVLPSESDRALTEATAAGHRLFLVTDGNAHVQAKKVTALGLHARFEHAYLTNRYGRHASKPSPIVFNLMLRRTKSSAEDLVYIGDNPAKDFVGVSALGGHTIRVSTGPYAAVQARDGYDAELRVETILDAVASLDGLCHRKLKSAPTAPSASG